MSRTINPDSYAILLSKYKPKVIETEAENETAISLAEELEHKKPRTPEEDTLLTLLIALIEKFEQEHYPLPEANPHSILLHLMEAQNIQYEDLVGVIDANKNIVFDLVNGKREISKQQATSLGKFFHVSSDLFT